MKAKKDRCYIYMRVSTSMQVEGYSLEAQKERLTKFADFQHMSERLLTVRAQRKRLREPGISIIG